MERIGQVRVDARRLIMEFKSDWGSTPQEVIAGIMQVLEREVEWPLSDVLVGDRLANAMVHVRAIREILNEELI